MITLIKNADIFAPDAIGRQDILIANNKIAAIEKHIDISSAHVEVVDGDDLIAIPGLVDSLVHISGGGGEGGFHTRTPAMSLTDATLAGVTTVIGALGTDATTRTLPDLLAKAHALETEGLTSYCYTGSYQIPVRTLTGSITDDIILIDKMIGVGEIAIADHRSSQPSWQDLARLASEARVGGMLSGKSGIVYIHTGASDSQLNLLHQVIEHSDIPASQFYPTHINRNQHLLEAGAAWCRAGGVIDMTTSTNEQFIADGEIPAATAIAWCLQQGIPASQLSMSSDGNASLPVFDNNGRLIGLEVGRVASLMQALQTLLNNPTVKFEDAVACVTRTPATQLGLEAKGVLAVDKDADIVLLKAADYSVHTVFAKGQCLVEQGIAIKKGTFE